MLSFLCHSFKNNVHLYENIYYSNLSDNKFPKLPMEGLQNLQQLKTFHNEELRAPITAKELPKIKTLVLSYAYHCCDFLNPGVSCVILPYKIYSYKYLESDLIKDCHVIFIHSLGQPLIVRYHSKVHRSRGNSKEIHT